MPRVALLVLGLVLVIQVGFILSQKPWSPTPHTSWRNYPQTITAAKDIADLVVLGKVTKIQRGDDHIVKLSNGSEDRVEVEIITVQIEKTYKGEKQDQVDVFREPNVTKENPQYKNGERYLLFLEKPDPVWYWYIKGKPVEAWNTVGPQGQNLIMKDNKIKTSANRDSSGQFSQFEGKLLSEFESEIEKTK